MVNVEGNNTVQSTLNDRDVSLIVYIGPPKTATTSLQLALEQKLPDGFSFLGAYQPRERNGPTLCHVLNDLSRGILDGTSEKVIDFVKNVHENKKNGKISLVVEEVLLVSRKEARWDEKICALASNISSFSAPAITLRNPIDGIYSLKRELGGQLGFINRSSVFFFGASHQAKVFDYRYLLQTLKNAGFSKVYIESFRRLTTHGYDFSRISERSLSDQKLKLNRENVNPKESKPRGIEKLILCHLKREWISDFEALESLIAKNSKSSLFDLEYLLTFLVGNSEKFSTK